MTNRRSPARVGAQASSSSFPASDLVAKIREEASNSISGRSVVKPFEFAVT
jgi:hypothetical protein